MMIGTLAVTLGTVKSDLSR